ncbi:EamA family transporter [Candidatus Micrarchaeota archaeon]|nr:EamA family transporter [Candidatus Micrarchaeota archaeon]
MLEFIPSLVSVSSYGTVSALSKRAIFEMGRHKAIVYAYLAMILLLVLGAAAMGIVPAIPENMHLMYLVQVATGGLGAIAAYKALHYGKSSIVSPMSKTYVLLVLATSIIFLGEQLAPGQIAGSVLVLLAALILSMKGKEIKPEKWMLYLFLSILCRTYYYTFIKNFVTALGPFQTTLVLELGIVLFIAAFHALRKRDLAPPGKRKLAFPAMAGAMIFTGSLFYSISVGTIGAALTAAISAGSPIINSIASFFLLKEKLDRDKYAAIMILAAGLVLIFLA